jgi:hypothetical protein
LRIGFSHSFLVSASFFCNRAATSIFNFDQFYEFKFLNFQEKKITLIKPSYSTMNEANQSTDSTLQENDGENITIINDSVNVDAKHISAGTKKMLEALRNSVSKSAVDSGEKTQKDSVQSDFTTVPTGDPDVDAKKLENAIHKKKVLAPNVNSVDEEMKNTDEQESRTFGNHKLDPVSTLNDTLDVKLTVLITGPIKNTKPYTNVVVEKKVPVPSKETIDADISKKKTTNDHPSEKEPKWNDCKEPPKQNADCLIEVKPHSSDTTITTDETEEPTWCCCGITCASITAAIVHAICACIASLIVYAGIINRETGAPYFWCANIFAILSFSMMGFNLNVAGRSTSSLYYVTGIGNIVSASLLLLLYGIETAKHNYNELNHMVSLAVLSILLIPPALIFVAIGRLQIEVAARLQKKEAETKKECKNPILNN